MNISAGLIILIIILIRKVFITKINHIIISIMWIMALLRLILPFSDTSKYSIFNLFYLIKNFTTNSNISSYITQDINLTNSIKSANILPTNQYNILTIVWIVGIAILSINFFVQLFYTKKLIKRSKTINLLNVNEIDSSITRINLKRKVNIKISSDIISPVSFGIFKPVILFPEHFKFNNIELLNHIIIHEYMHIKHYHFIIKMFLIVFLCIFWFNPAVWLLYLYVNRDIEILCDKQVIKFIGYAEREKYASNLVYMLSEKKEKEYGLKVYNNFIKNSNKERICSIMKIKNITTFSTFSAIIIAISTSFVFATSSNINNGAENDKLDIIISDDIYDDANSVDGVDEIPALELDISEIEDCIKRESRTATYLVINNYRYVTSYASPAKINVTVNDRGYTYKGTLYLDSCVHDKLSGQYIGYYSGRVYR